MTCKHYIDVAGVPITLDTGEDLSTATNLRIYIRKPDGTELEKTASVTDTTKLTCTTTHGDLDQPGFYRAQVGFTKGGWTGRGSTFKFAIYPKYA
jgi:hypothetical protein